MTVPGLPPDAWSFAAPPAGAGVRAWKPRRAIIAVVFVLVLISAVVTWLVWPKSSPHPEAEAGPTQPRSMLNGEPTTVILNGLDIRSLYPPGYIDYDSEQHTDDDGYEYDPEREYHSTSSPPDCEDDPLWDVRFDFDNKDPDKYREYPILLLMYPVDDPGGNSKEGARSFAVYIYPAKDMSSLGDLRQWYTRCQGAQVTTTVTKAGQVIETRTRTQDHLLGEAPPSPAKDSFARTRVNNHEACSFVGLVRGLIVEVTCPSRERHAGEDLFRTVVQRVYDIDAP